MITGTPLRGEIRPSTRGPAPSRHAAACARPAPKIHAAPLAARTQMNTAAHATLARRGLVFNDVDAAPFRAQLSGVYASWKERLGTRCWSLLEQSAKLKA